MDGGAWWATVHGVTKSWTRVSQTVSPALGIRGIPSKSSQSSWRNRGVKRAKLEAWGAVKPDWFKRTVAPRGL